MSRDYKAYVRLGANLKKGDLIKEEKIGEIISVLTRFKQAADQHRCIIKYSALQRKH